eukprot:9350850-Karenia_brevis.AAC.1
MTFTTCITWKGGLHNPLALPGWKIVLSSITWMDDLHYLHYLEGRPSSSTLPGWTIFITLITWMDDLHYLHHV